MRIAYDLEELKALVAPGAAHVATIGNFDGVHLGHRRLLGRVREYADGRGIPAVAITFDPHPLRVISGVQLPDLLTSLPRKLELLREAGMDLALVLRFTPTTAAMSPEEFVRSVMVDGLRLEHLVIGYDYALGKGRAGTCTVLSVLGRTWGFSVEQAPPLIIGGETVSSSLIRERIRSGAMDAVPPLLGRLHSVEGDVIHGQGRGRTLGFPTANVSLGDMLLPPPGVYATWAEILPDGDVPPNPASVAPAGTQGRPLHMSVTSVGTNPTFGGTSLSLESHLLNWNEDAYGTTLRLHFARRMRQEMRFSSVRALQNQIAADVRDARETLRSGNM
jgi:riboflavin kinase/FMN adenylyltransferase